MIFPTFLLTLGFADDLLTKKVHNTLSLALMGGALIYSLSQHQFTTGMLGLVTAFGLLFPLFLLRTVGAGDVKLMMAFGLATSPIIVLEVLVFGFIWAALFGLTKIMISKNWDAVRGMALMIISPLTYRPSHPVSLPMTFPLLLGWLSYLHLQAASL